MNRKQRRAEWSRNPQSKVDAKNALLNKIFDLAHKQMALGEPMNAIESFQSLLPHKPENAGRIYHNIGVCLEKLGRVDRAFDAYKRAIDVDPKLLEAYNNMGSLLHRHRKVEGAVQVLEHAISLNPDFAPAHHNLGNVYAHLGDLGKAIDCQRTTLALEPDHIAARFELCSLRRRACDWPGLEDDIAVILKEVRETGYSVNPFNALTMGATLEHVQEHTQIYARTVNGDAREVYTTYKTAPFSRYDKKKRKIKIGFVSSDYRQHPVAILLSELIEKLDRSRFEVIAYCNGVDDGSKIRKRIKAAFDKFISIKETNDEDVAKMINDEKVDILIDLQVYTTGGRSKVFFYRPAPVQVNYLGYPATSGSDFIDYILADRFVAPVEHQQFYDEAIVQLPDTYFPNDTQRVISEETPTRAECNLPEDGFVFCSFNTPYKITEPMFDIWMRLLEKVEGSVFWLFHANKLCKNNIQREVIARGIDPSRVIFAERKDLIEDHLARCRNADLFLDTTPYNAHTTAADALWVGLPVMTYPSEVFSGRVASSLLNAIGMPEMVTDSLEEYENLALELATNPEKLGKLKQKLEKNRDTTALFDIEKYTKNIELAFENMVHLHSEGEKPTPFAVSELPSN